MNKITPELNANKMLPKLVALSAYEVYLNQVKSAVDTIRFSNKGMSYLAPQLGGLAGQRKIVSKSLVLEIIDFEVS